MPRSGRRPGEPATQQRIAAAARELFAEAGVSATSIRAIAARAGVDPSLVLHYYGSKARLFASVMALPVNQWTEAGRLLGGGEEDIGVRLVDFALNLWEDAATRPAMLGLVRSALSDPGAADILRDLFTRQGPVLVVRALGRPNPELRTQLIASQLIGLALIRYVIRVEPLASADRQTVVRLVAPIVQGYATADLSEATRASHPRGPGARA